VNYKLGKLKFFKEYINSGLKGTVRVILSDPPGRTPDLQHYPLNIYLIYNNEDIVDFLGLSVKS